MLFKTDSIDKSEIRMSHLSDSSTGEHLYKQGNNSAHDKGIALTGEIYSTITLLTINPYLTLTSGNFVLRELILSRIWW